VIRIHETVFRARVSTTFAEWTADFERLRTVRALLADTGQTVTRGANTLDFWWVKALPRKPDATGAGWPAVAEGAIVGALRLSKPLTDIRGLPIKPGVYTIRYALPLVPVLEGSTHINHQVVAQFVRGYFARAAPDSPDSPPSLAVIMRSCSKSRRVAIRR